MKISKSRLTTKWRHHLNYRITDKQRAVYDFVASYIERHKYPPSYRDIGEAFGVTVKAAHDHVLALVKKGWLTHHPGLQRTLTPTAEALAAGKEENA